MYKLLTILWIILLYAPLSFAEKIYAWKVSNGSHKLYIVGSIHAMKQKDYPLNPKLMETFQQSDNLVVEIDTNKIDKATKKLIKEESSYENNNKGLSTHISAKAFTAICAKFTKYGYTKNQINLMKPWWLMMLAAQFDLVKLGIDPQYGIDQFFTKEAKRTNKRIIEIEGMQKQLSIFFQLSKNNPEAFIQFILEGDKNQEALFKQLVQLCKTGNLYGMEKYFDKIVNNPKLKPITNQIIIKRNQEMTQKVITYLNSPQTHFVIIGAGHFVGKTGLVNALLSKGYTIEQLEK
jgi:uncharacterized protein YbaP (TraB family)